MVKHFSCAYWVTCNPIEAAARWHMSFRDLRNEATRQHGTSQRFRCHFVTELLDGAERKIDRSMYALVHAKFANALIEAHRDRNVSIRVVVDKTQMKGDGSKVRELFDVNVPLSFTSGHHTCCT